MPVVRIHDIHMYYELHGDGNPLVLIVGMVTDISEWTSIIHPLAKKHRVLAFDNRGAGRTDKPDIPYSIEMMAGDPNGLMRQLVIYKERNRGRRLHGRASVLPSSGAPDISAGY